MNKEDAITAAADIGFAIATMSAFKQRPGVSSEQLAQALGRLDNALELISKLIEPSSS